jgi:hypothetical protein
MGYEAACTLRLDGATFSGKARLEDKQLVFRGGTRLAVSLAQIEDARARDGRLAIVFSGRRAELELGAAAAAWARRISHPPSRIEKLGVKPGMRVALIGMTDPELAEALDSQGARLQDGRATGLDIIFLGVKGVADLARLDSLIGRIKPSGAIWVVRGKGKAATVTEAQSMAAGRRAGLVDVKVVSFSETATAEKYVLPRRARPPAGSTVTSSIRSRAVPATTAQTRARSVRSASLSPRRRGSAPSPDRT